ncbi:MAG: hypothetical protein J5599_08375 [Spirochaetales bacterium]|nr:hypothetical protein [Spirochaetales bacterium]
MKEKFLRFFRLKNIGRKDIIRYAAISLVVYLIVPLISLIPVKTNLGNWFLLIILPVYLLAWGIPIGIRKGFCPAFAAASAVLFIPCGLLYSFRPVWQYMIFYFLFAAAGNLVAEFLWVTRGHGKHTLDPEMLSQDLDRPLKED